MPPQQIIFNSYLANPGPVTGTVISRKLNAVTINEDFVLEVTSHARAKCKNEQVCFDCKLLSEGESVCLFSCNQQIKTIQAMQLACTC
jgi:hypothetical protein